MLPVVEGFARREVLVSVDTSSPEVMRLAADAGAAMINDVRGFRRPGALAALAATRLAAMRDACAGRAPNYAGRTRPMPMS